VKVIQVVPCSLGSGPAQFAGDIHAENTRREAGAHLTPSLGADTGPSKEQHARGKARRRGGSTPAHQHAGGGNIPHGARSFLGRAELLLQRGAQLPERLDLRVGSYVRLTDFVSVRLIDFVYVRLIDFVYSCRSDSICKRRTISRPTPMARGRST